MAFDLSRGRNHHLLDDLFQNRMRAETVSDLSMCAELLAKPARATDLNLSCRRARFAFVPLRPVVLDLGV
jgi:hypothetical protein